MFYIKDIVSKLVNSKIKDLGIYVSDAFKSSEEGKTIFNIVLDSDSVIDLNKITEASRIINKIMDETSLVEQDYDELDIENIGDEFNKVIPKKRIIDDSIKSSIDSIKIEPLSVSKVEDDDSNIELPNISEYEFELVKIKAVMETNEEVEMYLKMIKNKKIKESIFCYWCTIYEEELLAKKVDLECIVNKVAISDLTKDKYQKRVFLTIENNSTPVLETGTEVNFIEIANYIKESKKETNKLDKLYKYFNKGDDDVLLVGLKMNRADRQKEQNIDFLDEL